MRAIAGLFGKSPFLPLQEHIIKISECVDQMKPMFLAMADNDQQGFDNAKGAISLLERQADEIKNSLRDNLPRTLLMPIARPDLLELLNVQDGMADTVQDIAVLLSVKKPAAGEDFIEDVHKLVDYAIKSTHQVKSIYKRLNDLVESTFRGTPVEDVLETIKKIGKTEHKADKTSYRLLQRLFNESDDMPIQDFIMWDKILVKIGHIADLSQKTSNRIRIILSH